MVEFLIDRLHDTRFLAMLFAAVAAIATVMTLAMPLLAPDNLNKRLKSVALEREKIRARERERMARGEKVTLRQSPKQYMKTVVDQFNLVKWVGQEEARDKLLQAGYRGHAPYVAYLFFRMVTPIVALIATLIYVFLIIDMKQPLLIKLGLVIGAAYIGMQLPWLFLKNKIGRRQLDIKRAFPDALDLLLICVESGMSIEAAFRKVSQEVGTQSVPLAEEFMLTTAELSYLQDRRHGLRELGQAHRSGRREGGLRRVATDGTLRNAAWTDVARDGAGKPRHAHVGGREESRRVAAEADGSDDPILPAGALRRHSRPRRDPRHGDASDRLNLRLSPARPGSTTILAAVILDVLAWIR